VIWMINLMHFLEDTTHLKSSLVRLDFKLLAIVQAQANPLLDHGLWRPRISSTETAPCNTLGRLNHSQQLSIQAPVSSQFLQKNTTCSKTCGKMTWKTLIVILMPPSVSLSRPVIKLKLWSSQWASRLERPSLSSHQRVTYIRGKTSASLLLLKTHLIS
jgi:hypothetical protein